MLLLALLLLLAATACQALMQQDDTSGLRSAPRTLLQADSKAFACWVPKANGNGCKGSDRLSVCHGGGGRRRLCVFAFPPTGAMPALHAKAPLSLVVALHVTALLQQ